MPVEFSTSGPVCPHCQFRFTPDEPYYFKPDQYTEDECPECGKSFKVEVEHETQWYTYPKDED